MRQLSAIIGLLIVLIIGGCSHSQPVPPPVVTSDMNILNWNRISQAKEYHVYAVWVPGCDFTKAFTMLKVIPQTPVGTHPTYWRELAGSVGCYTVTAVNEMGEESKFSKPLAFDRR